MNTQTFSLTLGAPVPDWQARPHPAGVVLTGNACRLEPVDPARHSDAWFEAYSEAPGGRDWLYMLVGPFPDAQAYRAYSERMARETDPLHFAVVDLGTGLPLGTLALMRQQPQHSVIEVGFVTFSPVLQRSRIATEAHFLLMSYVFDQLNYRRFEWKCDSLNQRSSNAAERLGFQYEGTFRQAMVYKGRNRDTAWFSILDKEWRLVKAAFQQWLAPDNFDATGQQIRRLQ
ncbi:GNAT family N-acetyltransferase [Aquitalea aquatica]|uniref:GNAT family N-acetyltransferase n=1 Tax=Aquitalea aquatica TaxID=3044273 RepID=A0A838Y5K5_9NEIS|nr:GNAT family protein [Aquitalea magnusonii]MBA4710763.1 GNAT family N-acetyltransferase [Aquitalea magnusonii]